MASTSQMEFLTGGACRAFLIFLVISYFCFVYLSNQYSNCPSSTNNIFLPFIKISPSPSQSITPPLKLPTHSPTKLNHLLFGLVGSERAWHHRRSYIESWWRPNETRGYLFLDVPPTGDLLPWSPASPPYRVSDDLTGFLGKSDVTAQRIINAIMEVFREDHGGFRWLVMGDDDSIFFVENMVEVLGGYDHTKYYYFGGHSEFILSNYWFSFSQGFGGAGFILSYPLAKAVAADMHNCLNRYRHLNAADLTTMSCIADFGVSLTTLKGIHQIDLRGDISGFLSSHPNFPVMSLHHFDMVDPIFPFRDRANSTRHLMRAAAADHSRLLQQTVCYHRPTNWSFSISWGYSVHMYERIMPRSYLQYPLETFKTWGRSPRPPHFMFNTRWLSRDPCEAPHLFFYQTLHTTPNAHIITRFTPPWSRDLPPCPASGNHSADHVAIVQVYSPNSRRSRIDKSECCDIVRINGGVADVKIRECAVDEIIA